MKEDKENTRPRDKQLEVQFEENEKAEKTNIKEKKEPMTKIVIRRLPPSLTKEELEEQLQPLPEVDYLEFFSNDTSLYPHLYSRAYINFKNQEDIVLFSDRFDGYVFIDNRGQEYPAIVEFAPFQKIAKKRSKKRDAKAGTIDEDADYKRFLETYNGDDEKFTSTPETLLEEIEAKTKELVAKKTTPLLDFLKNKQRLREEKKEERRRRELERKRLRDDERRKWREEERRRRKDTEKQKKGEQGKEEPKIKLLRKPDRAEDGDSEKPRDKAKRSEKERSAKEERAPYAADTRKRQTSDHRDDRARKAEEDGRKEYRERDRDREQERERRQKEPIRRQDEERRRKRERHDGENAYRKREEDGKKDKERAWEKRKGGSSGETSSQTEKPEKSYKDLRKEESAKRDRLRNKDRPAIQLYQPGSRSRRGGGGAEAHATERKAESETKGGQEKGEE